MKQGNITMHVVSQISQATQCDIDLSPQNLTFSPNWPFPSGDALTLIQSERKKRHGFLIGSWEIQCHIGILVFYLY